MAAMFARSLAMTACLAAGFFIAGVPQVRAQPAVPLMAGMAAPEIDKGTDWLGVKGPLTLKDLRGKFVILDFWTLC